MITAEIGAAFEAVYDSGTTGLVGAVEVQIVDNQGAVVSGPTSANIIELGVTGQYRANLTAPGTVGQYSIQWSDDGAFTAGLGGVEDLVVVAAGAVAPFPPLEPTDGEGPATGPCRAWTTVEDIAACCPAFTDGTDTSGLEVYARTASEIMWEISGHQFSGGCGPVTVRPCSTTGCFPGGIYGWRWSGHYWGYGGQMHVCGCSPTSEIRLSGYPVREIIQVKIDGEVLDEDEYRLDNHRDLVRMRDPDDPGRRVLWPACQVIDLDDTEEGTFSITYTYGQDPPQLGIDAAAQLACQLFQGCDDGGDDAECVLPSNVTQIVRQGITMENVALAAGALLAGSTGLSSLDAFIGIYGGQKGRRSAVWSPDVSWPRVSTAGGS